MNSSPDTRPLFVLARNKEAASAWAAFGAPRGEVFYAGRRGEHLRGHDEPAIVAVTGWATSRTTEERVAVQDEIATARARLIDPSCSAQLASWRSTS